MRVRKGRTVWMFALPRDIWIDILIVTCYKREMMHGKITGWEIILHESCGR